MNGSRRALLAQLALTVYFEAVQWIPLGQWNYEPGFPPLLTQAARGQLTLSDAALVTAFLIPLVAYLIAYRMAASWLKWLCLTGYAAWLALQIKTWWVAYLFGASDRWVSTYHRVFSHSTTLLPSFGRHFPPDGMHLVLQVLLLCVVVALTRELLSQSPHSKEHRAA
jgi:hypothetical protein